LKEVYLEDLQESMSVWEDVRGEGGLWGRYKEFQERGLKWFIESSLRDAVSRKIGVRNYERSDGRCGYRNGSYLRTLVTPYGSVEIEVPRLREGSYEHNLWDANGLLSCQARELILETYLSGPSTRRVGEALERVLGYRVSAATVSSICQGLDKLVREYWRRELGDEWQYLLLDGIVVKNRSATFAEKRFVLVAMGISRSGKRQILSFRQSESESEVCWSSFLEDLIRRGLIGNNLKLISTDGNAGMIAAIKSLWPYVPRQRCWVHKLRNIASKTRRSNEKSCLDGAKQIYLAENRTQAIHRFKLWRDKWKDVETKAVMCMQNDIGEMLEFFELPKEHQKTMRTTNPIERVFREVRRRIRTISCFTNRKSVDRMLYAVFTYQNRQWDRNYRPGQFTHNT